MAWYSERLSPVDARSSVQLQFMLDKFLDRCDSSDEALYRRHRADRLGLCMTLILEHSHQSEKSIYQAGVHFSLPYPSTRNAVAAIDTSLWGWSSMARDGHLHTPTRIQVENIRPHIHQYSAWNSLHEHGFMIFKDELPLPPKEQLNSLPSYWSPTGKVPMPPKLQDLFNRYVTYDHHHAQRSTESYT